ncbi:MAG: HAD-IA family hydrolase [Dinoroseobacter sp.]|nr:HAD-IA family hydrolase [Dinoroseobacter sp.]
MTLKLVLFDVDGTLVDSQAQIMTAMTHAFEAEDLPVPDRAAVREIIGLSLSNAIERLAPAVDPLRINRLVERYKDAYVAQRVTGGGEAASPLYPGALAALEALSAFDDVLLGVATGKSKRGLVHLFDAYNLGHFFVTTQVADNHPSKPHPSMVTTALSETGVAPRNAVMLGDTTYDMEMGKAGGVHTLGVGWGYHAPDDLREAGAERVLVSYAELLPALESIWRDR